MNTRYISEGGKVIDTLLQRYAPFPDPDLAAYVASGLNNFPNNQDVKWLLPAGVARYYVAKNTNGQEIVVDRLTCEFHLPEQGADTPLDEADCIVEDLEDGCLVREGIDWAPLNASVLAKPSKGSDREPSFTVRFAVVSLWRDGVEHSAIFDRKSKDVALFGVSPSEPHWESVASACSKLNSASAMKSEFDWEASRHGDSITERPVSPTPKQQSFFYVFRENGDKPRVQHVSFDLAQKEAERIAGTCDDRVFVLKAVSVSKRQTKVNTQEMT